MRNTDSSPKCRLLRKLSTCRESKRPTRKTRNIHSIWDKETNRRIAAVDVLVSYLICLAVISSELKKTFKGSQGNSVVSVITILQLSGKGPKDKRIGEPLRLAVPFQCLLEVFRCEVTLPRGSGKEKTTIWNKRQTRPPTLLWEKLPNAFPKTREWVSCQLPFDRWTWQRETNNWLPMREKDHVPPNRLRFSLQTRFFNSNFSKKTYANAHDDSSNSRSTQTSKRRRFSFLILWRVNDWCSQGCRWWNCSLSSSFNAFDLTNGMIEPFGLSCCHSFLTRKLAKVKTVRCFPVLSSESSKKFGS